MSEIKNQTMKILQDQGIRITQQRQLILQELIKSLKPLSAAEIHRKLIKQDSGIRLSTIYRNLKFFSSRGLIREFNLDKSRKEKFFEFIESHHHHLICISCGEIKCLGCPLEDYESELAERTGYQIKDHNIKIYGLCPECQTGDI